MTFVHDMRARRACPSDTPNEIPAGAAMASLQAMTSCMTMQP
jgi:hypothetical protein